MLRCIIGRKYPLGVSHRSLEHMTEKRIDALLCVGDSQFRYIIAGLLDMDGMKRIDFFRALPEDMDRIPSGMVSARISVDKREFKSTSFIATEPKHALPLSLASPFWLTPVDTPPLQNRPVLGRGRSVSRDQMAAHLAAGLDIHQERWSYGTESELVLLNPTEEPPRRALSFVKYLLRCAGILYHIQGSSKDLTKDLPSVGPPAVSCDYTILHCVLRLPNDQKRFSPATTLLTQIRPAFLGVQTSASRSSSSPPTRNKSQQQVKKAEDLLRCLEFWIQFIPVYARHPTSERSESKRRSAKSDSEATFEAAAKDQSRCVKFRIRISDDQALDAVKTALSAVQLPEVLGATDKQISLADSGQENESRGRTRTSRSISK